MDIVCVISNDSSDHLLPSKQAEAKHLVRYIIDSGTGALTDTS